MQCTEPYTLDNYDTQYTTRCNEDLQWEPVQLCNSESTKTVCPAIVLQEFCLFSHKSFYNLKTFISKIHIVGKLVRSSDQANDPH